MLNNEILISTPTEAGVIDRIIFKQSQWLITRLCTRARRLLFVLYPLIEENYIGNTEKATACFRPQNKLVNIFRESKRKH